MSKARNLADLLDTSGDVKTDALDNVETAKFLGKVEVVTADKTLVNADYGTYFKVNTANVTLTLPAVAEGMAFVVKNTSSGDIRLKAASSSTYIGEFQGSTLILNGQEAIVSASSSAWNLNLYDGSFPVKIIQLEGSGSYTPNPMTSSFLTCVGGTGGGAAWTGNNGGNGGSYAEKLYTSVTGPYSFTTGANTTGVGGTTTFDNITVNGSGQNTVGTATGGDFNASGGQSNATGNLYIGGGGGAGRHGNGSNNAVHANVTANNYNWGGANPDTTATGVVDVTGQLTYISGVHRNGGTGDRGDQQFNLSGATDPVILKGGGGGSPRLRYTSNSGADTSGEVGGITVLEIY